MIRAHVGQGLRADLERLESAPATMLVESLKRHGVSEEVLHDALHLWRASLHPAWTPLWVQAIVSFNPTMYL
jgi:hypothetical protein